MKAAIFDFNGTMVNDDLLNNGAWQSFMLKYIGRELSEKEMNDYVHGIHADVPIRHFLGEDMDEARCKMLVEEKESSYRNLCQNHPEIFFLQKGLEQFLNYCKEKRIKVSIGSAAPEKNMRFFYEQLNLQRWFEFDNLVYNDGTCPGKPAPDVYLRCAARLGEKPEDCVVFEDAVSGIKAGVNGGFGKVVGVKTKLTDQQCMTAGATDIIESFEDLNQLVAIMEK